MTCISMLVVADILHRGRVSLRLSRFRLTSALHISSCLKPSINFAKTLATPMISSASRTPTLVMRRQRQEPLKMHRL